MAQRTKRDTVIAYHSLRLLPWDNDAVHEGALGEPIGSQKRAGVGDVKLLWIDSTVVAKR